MAGTNLLAAVRNLAKHADLFPGPALSKQSLNEASLNMRT